MKNFKISTRLGILIFTLSILLIVVGGIGLFGISKTDDALRSVYEDRTVPMGQLSEIQQLLLRNRLLIANSLIDPAPAEIIANTAEVEANISAISKIWDAFLATDLTVEEEKIAKKFGTDRKQLVQEGLKPAVIALRGNNAAEAHRLVAEKIRTLYPAVGQGIEALMQLQLVVAKQEYTDAVARFENIRLLSIGSTLLGLTFAAFFGLYLVRNISSSLSQAIDAANAVTQGDLNHTIQVNGKDEITDLLRALSAMQLNLGEIVSNVRKGSESVANASSEIAQGNQDLSDRTEHQASALEETAASMEQLSSSVQQNAENSRHANQLAQQASQVAKQGGEVVGEVVETMKGINESSIKIADIIGVVDGIAFQTNILALNAAVEAARAGDQGRGFAVVASEVRSLAGRSAAAAKEIKALIGTSVDRVEQGTVLVGQAKETMSEVVEGIRRVTDLMGDISAASNEQSLGVAQIGEAVTQMDQVTQQNAALVEQMAAAASSLKSQAQELVGTVAVFKLAGQPASKPKLAFTPATVRMPVSSKMHFKGAERRTVAVVSKPTFLA
jgi:methyl-accepting chemotaxis protein